MLKVLVWQVSNNMRWFKGAIKVLERQYDGVELIGVTASEETQLSYEGQNVPFIPLTEVNGGGV